MEKKKKRLNKKKRQVSLAEEFQITHVGFSLKEVGHEPPNSYVWAVRTDFLSQSPHGKRERTNMTKKWS